MKKLTLLFLSATLGASVYCGEPKFKVGDEIPYGGKILVVIGLDEDGQPLFKTKDSLKKVKKSYTLVKPETSTPKEDCNRLTGCSQSMNGTKIIF